MKRITARLFLLFLFFAAFSLSAQELDSLLKHKRIYQAVHIGENPAPRIDGNLDEALWSLGEWQGDFTQQFPYSGQPASENTYFKILYDHSNLYVSIILQDSEPEQIVERLGRRDSRAGDMTGFALDSYHDKRTAFEFSMSVAGQKMDLKHLGDWEFDLNWNAVWDGATSRTDTGWIAEIQLPFSQIRYSGQDQQLWGLHIYRVINRKQEASSWDPIPRNAPATVYLFGELQGIQQIRSSRQVEFLPYVLGSYTQLSGGENPKALQYNLGLDAKVGISSDFTLDLSVNPDFGQVEADPSVLNLTAFETFFDEKRPFFLEGNDVFDFSIDEDIPYYSRRIGSAPGFYQTEEDVQLSEVADRTTILGAAKITGKSKSGWSAGLVNGLSASASGLITDINGTEKEVQVFPLSNYLASRIKKDLKEGQTVIGGMFSLVKRISADSLSSRLLPGTALSGGLDLLQYWDNKNYFLEVKGIASQLKGSPESILRRQLSHIHRFQRMDAGHLDLDEQREVLGGHGGLLSLGKQGGKWNFLVQGQYRSPGLNLNDMGYLRQADFIRQRNELSYRMNEPKTWIRNYTLTLFQQAEWSFGAENTASQAGLMLVARNNQLWSLHLKSLYDFSSLDTRELRGGPALRRDRAFLGSLSLSSNSAKDLYGMLSYSYSHLGRPGSKEHMLQFSLTWVPVKRLNITGISSFTRQSYHQQYVNTLTVASLTDYLVGGIDRNTTSFTLRSELYLTPELSIQFYGSPYYSVGKYADFRRVDQSQSKDFESRLEALNPSYDAASDSYTYMHQEEGFSFSNPDFSFMQFRSNLVFRWEYKLGSTVYFVWAHDRSGWESVYNPIGDILGDLFGSSGQHVFMIKANFWFPI